MDDQNQTNPAAGAGQSDANGQSSAGGNPFGDASANATQPQVPAAGGVTETPPWLNFNAAEPAATPAAASAPMENAFDPFSNPFDGGFGASTPPTEEAQPVVQAPQSFGGDDSSTSGDDDAMALLMKLQQQFEYEEHDFEETLKMHEENIKAEQDAIRELRQGRREKMEEMKKVIMGLEKMVGLTREKSEAPAPKKEQNREQPRRQEKKATDMQSAKKVDSDDFFTAA